MSRPGVHNLILLILVLVVCAVTGLNHYTTQQSTEYFIEVSKQETRELVRTAATKNAQELAGKAFALALLEGGRSVIFEQERNNARKVAMQYMNLCKQFADTIQSQTAQILEMEELLKKHNIPFAKPGPAGRKPTGKIFKQPTGKNLRAAVSNAAWQA